MPVRSNFRACLDQFDFGPTTLSFVGAASQRIRRTPAKRSRTRYPTFFLLQFRVGHGLLRQRGREMQAHAGECVLINGTEPYDLDCPQSTTAAILRMPEDWLRRWLPSPETSSPMVFAARRLEFGAVRRHGAVCAWKPAQNLALPRSTVAEQIAASPDARPEARAPNASTPAPCSAT